MSLKPLNGDPFEPWFIAGNIKPGKPSSPVCIDFAREKLKGYENLLIELYLDGS